jgi:peptide/nickel transport system substrate-binding protein
MGQTWLQTHDAGTGPYTLTSLLSGQSYDMDAYPNYWGSKPYYTHIHISIVRNITTEVLEFQNGQLDLLTTGVSTSDLEKLKGNSKFRVTEYPVIYKTTININPTRNNIFSDQAIRQAVRLAINRPMIVTATRKDTAVLSKDFYPFHELPPGMAPDNPKFDPSVLAKLVKASSLAKNVVIGYFSGDAPDTQAAELLQTELQAAGMTASLRAYTSTEWNDLPNHPDQAPDINIGTSNPDTANPGSWAQTYLLKGAPLNVVGVNVPTADDLVNKALAEASPDTAQQEFVQAAEAYVDSGQAFTLADVQASVAAPAYLTHIAHSAADPYGVILAETHP